MKADNCPTCHSDTRTIRRIMPHPTEDAICFNDDWHSTPAAPETAPRRVIELGTIVKPYGEVAAVGSISGERYYWLIGEDKSVSMMPADVIEVRAETPRKEEA